MKALTRLSLLLLLLLNSSASSFAQEDILDLVPEEIIIIGRQPGPPMWKISNGENVLWIFPRISLMPKGMIWESDKVAEVIANSQEVITEPAVDVSISKLVMFNPINMVRGFRFGRRLMKNPDDATLNEVVPAELYERYLALKQEHFPNEKGIEKLRPYVASGQMVGNIYGNSDLIGTEDVSKKIRQLIRRNRSMIKTEIEVKRKIEGNYKQLTERVQGVMDSITLEQELQCFERRVDLMEDDLDDAKHRANDWARGFVDEFRNASLPGSSDDVCEQIIVTGPEQEFLKELEEEVNNEWIAAAENALNTNASTFAVLSIQSIIQEDGLIEQLRAKGYEIDDPFLN